MRQLIAKQGDRWAGEWLRARALPSWADQLDNLYGHVVWRRETVPYNTRVYRKGDVHRNETRPTMP